MHAECAIPPINQIDIWCLANCFNDYELMCFVAAMNNKGAAQHGATHIETVEGTNVAPGAPNCCAEVPESTRHIVEFAIETDGKSGVRK